MEVYRDQAVVDGNDKLLIRVELHSESEARDLCREMLALEDDGVEGKSVSIQSRYPAKRKCVLEICIGKDNGLRETGANAYALSLRRDCYAALVDMMQKIYSGADYIVAFDGKSAEVIFCRYVTGYT